MTEIDNYDLFNIFLVESRYNNDVFINSDNGPKKIILTTSKLKIPFGIEKYNNKFIINFEFFKYNNDENVNAFFKKIQKIDNFFCRLSLDDQIIKKVLIPDKIKKELKARIYIPCIKMRPTNFDPLVRLHLKYKNNNMISNFNTDANTIKNKFCVCEIEIGSLWMTAKNYGILLYLNKCDVCFD